MERLLRHTCLLELLTPSRCDSILGTRDSALILHELEQLGIVVSDDGETSFRLPEVVRQHLTAALGDAGQELPEDIRRRTAAVLEQYGEECAALRVLADGQDWGHVRETLVRAGQRAYRPGTCRWAATAPESLVREDALFALAAARHLLDDGCAAAAYRTAAQIPRLTRDADCSGQPGTCSSRRPSGLATRRQRGRPGGCPPGRQPRKPGVSRSGPARSPTGAGRSCQRPFAPARR